MYHMSGHMCKIWEIKIYFILNLAWHVTQPVSLLLGYQENTHCSSSSSIIGPLILHKRTLIVAVIYFIASSDCVWPTVSWQSGHRRMQTQPSWKNMQIKADSAQEAEPTGRLKEGDAGGAGVWQSNCCTFVGYTWLRYEQSNAEHTMRLQKKIIRVLIFSHLQPNTTSILQRCDAWRGGWMDEWRDAASLLLLCPDSSLT